MLVFLLFGRSHHTASPESILLKSSRDHIAGVWFSFVSIQRMTAVVRIRRLLLINILADALRNRTNVLCKCANVPVLDIWLKCLSC